MTARRHGISHLASDGRFRNPAQCLLIHAVSGSPTTIRGPRNCHGCLSRHESSEIFDEAPLFDAWRHELVLSTHFGKNFHTNIAVDRSLHRCCVEEFSAFIAETFLEHVHRIRRLTEEACTVTIRSKNVGKCLACFTKFFPGFWHSQLTASFCLERFLDFRIGKNIFPIIHDEYVTIIWKTVDFSVNHHLIVAIRRRNLLQFVRVAIFRYIRVKYFESARPRKIRHPSRNHVECVISTSSRAIFLHDLGEHLSSLHLDHLNLDTSQLFPKRSRKIERVKRLQASFPDDRNRLPFVFLGFLDSPISRTFRPRSRSRTCC